MTTCLRLQFGVFLIVFVSGFNQACEGLAFLGGKQVGHFQHTGPKWKKHRRKQLELEFRALPKKLSKPSVNTTAKTDAWHGLSIRQTFCDGLLKVPVREFRADLPAFTGPFWRFVWGGTLWLAFWLEFGGFCIRLQPSLQVLREHNAWGRTDVRLEKASVMATLGKSRTSW